MGGGVAAGVVDGCGGGVPCRVDGVRGAGDARGLDVWQMLHSMRPFRPFLPDGGKAGPGMVPRLGKWPEPDGWLREPVVAAGAPWDAR